MAILALKGPITQRTKEEKEPRKAIIVENSGTRIDTPTESNSNIVLSITRGIGCLLVRSEVSRTPADLSLGEAGRPFSWSQTRERGLSSPNQISSVKLSYIFKAPN